MNVLLGVCGGIAAYKSAEIVRALQDRGADVEVAMTAAAERFITPLTLNALTGKPVHTDLWSPDQAALADGPIEHIAVAQSCDVLLVAPASATTLARFAHGMADDFLSAVFLATQAPVVLAPAMNANMWHHPATRHNVSLLQQRGARIVEPGAGYLACGTTGAGRLADIQTIVDAVYTTSLNARNDLAGETILVTAGGTREPIDPVRFLGNRSSGRMGHALAEAALARGARVILITASTLAAPRGCEVHRVETAQQMQHALQAEVSRATVVIAAAAVADFRPVTQSSSKLRRSGPLSLELEPTPDLIAEVAQQARPGVLTIAFAAETEDLAANARAKLGRKGVHVIVANDVSGNASGFDTESNAGLILTNEGSKCLPLQSKRQMADAILDEIVTLRASHKAGFDARAHAVAEKPNVGNGHASN